MISSGAQDCTARGGEKQYLSGKQAKIVLTGGADGYRIVEPG
jgi:hypothetical protein